MYRVPIISPEQLEELKPELIGRVARFEWGNYGHAVGLIHGVNVERRGMSTIRFRNNDGRPDWLAVSTAPHHWALIVTTAEDMRPDESLNRGIYVRDVR